jgi:predicted nuclease of predicted toxin-antitoxin system
MKLLIDVNLSRAWKDVLRPLGYEVSHWEDIGPDDADDSVILEYAIDNGFVIMTNDHDFALMLAQSGAKAPSVLQLQSGSLRPSQLGAQVCSAIRQSVEALLDGALVTVRPHTARVSILPIRSKFKKK